jgi:hypothetical protein
LFCFRSPHRHQKIEIETICCIAETSLSGNTGGVFRFPPSTDEHYISVKIRFSSPISLSRGRLVCDHRESRHVLCDYPKFLTVDVTEESKVRTAMVRTKVNTGIEYWHGLAVHRDRIVTGLPIDSIANPAHDSTNAANNGRLVWRSGDKADNRRPVRFFYVRHNMAPLNGRAVWGSASCAGSLSRFRDTGGTVLVTPSKQRTFHPESVDFLRLLFMGGCACP